MIRIRSSSSVEEGMTGSKRFCGKVTVFLLLYKRLNNGSFRWPRTADEAMAITDDQYRMLMQGLEIIARHPITEVTKTPDLM